MSAQKPARAAADDSPEATGKGAGPPRPRLTYAQRALVLAARRDCPNATHAQIAKAAGISERTAYRILQNAGTRDMRQHVQDLLTSAVTERLDDWAEAASRAARKGYHQPSKDWLIAADAINADQPKASITQALTVQLAFALPGIPANLQPAPTDTQLRLPDSKDTAPQLEVDAPQLRNQLTDTAPPLNIEPLDCQPHESAQKDR